MHMFSLGKVCPKIYQYLRLSGKSTVMQLRPPKIEQIGNLSLCKDTFQLLRLSPEEISQAYREYAQSPFINAYLREHMPLSQNSNKLVSCLKQAIRESEPIKGKFYRGLTGCKDEEAVRNFIFKNEGFTSVTPEVNKKYAETFVIGRNSVLVEFDIKTPIKGFKANNYEILFDTNAFTPDKYDLVKIDKNYYKLIEKTKEKKLNFAKIISHFDEGNTLCHGSVPENYTQKSRIYIEEYTYTPRFGKNKGIVQTVPAHWEEIQEMLPNYHIDKLWSGGAGSGTSAIQNVVKKSLADPRTKGRVTLEACCIDGKTSPAGFYYKLGFRFGDAHNNKMLENWLIKGGHRENAPFISGNMFLPEENIEHCLNYAKNKPNKVN